jgi:hypothetical protein
MIRISTAPNDGGHTMIVYRVTADLLYVADPNYPAKLRTIKFDPASGKLGPYSSGASATAIAANGDTSYTLFAYVPWRSHATEATVASHWAEFEANKAGDAIFPGYGLRVQADTGADGKPAWEPLVDGYQTDKDSVTVDLTQLSDGAASRLTVYPGTSSTPVGPAAFRQTLKLAEGANAFGFYVTGRNTTGTDAAGNPVYEWNFVRFVRLTINRGPASPSPEASGGSWMLVKSEPRGGQAEIKAPADADNGTDATISDGSIRLTHWDAPDRSDATGLKVTWTSPPAQGAPGDEFKGSVTAAATCPAGSESGATFTGAVGAVLDPSAGGHAFAYTEATCASKSASDSGTFTFPTHADNLSMSNTNNVPGDTFEMRAEASVLLWSGAWIYTYEWRP